MVLTGHRATGCGGDSLGGIAEVDCILAVAYLLWGVLMNHAKKMLQHLKNANKILADYVKELRKC
jgi:hypothetical protein